MPEWESTTMTVPELIMQTARRYGVDPALAVEVGYAESRFNQAAVSPAGAIGVMQLMPATAAWLGVNPYILEQNIDGGVRYLKMQLDRFGDVASALAAYNWGPERVAAAIVQYAANWLTRAPAETQAFVHGILARLGQWVEQPGVPTLTEINQQVEQFRALPPTEQTLLLVVVGAMLAWALFDTVTD